MEKNRTFLSVIEKRFRTYQELGDHTFAQLDDAQMHESKHPGDNTIATIIKHLHGNMLSRFTDFLSTDGEKEWRDRDGEFTEDRQLTKEQLLTLWAAGWACVFDTIGQLKDDDLKKKVPIRGEFHLVLDALLRQLAHYAYHVGQLVYLAKHMKGPQWQSLSIPLGESQQFNKQMHERYE